MPALKNQKHEAFAQAVALGMPASQAYVEYVSRDGKCSDRTAEVEGSKLANAPECSLRISELRKAASDETDRRFALTKEEWLDQLQKAAKSADSTSGQVAALREIGKGMGFYEPEKVEHSGGVSIPGLSEAITAVFGRK